MKVVVLGGGPGGYVCAIRLAQLGAEVSLVEKESIGGTCLNVGCIPTKALLHTAELYHRINHEAKGIGINVSTSSIDWPGVQQRKQEVVERLVGGVSGLLKSNGIEYIKGEGRFEDAHTITVTNADGSSGLSFDKAVIATGAKPKIPPIPGADLPNVITSTEALSLAAIPERLCIIGGGVIGCELAGIYNAFGSKVTILEALPDILMTLDKDIVQVLKRRFRKDKIDVHTGVKVQSISKIDGGLGVAADDRMVEADYVLMATGRGPDLSHLGLEQIGIATEGGFIKADAATMQTNVSNIYAIGDCIGGIQLAHVASAEGETAAEHAMGHKPDKWLGVVPSGVYTTPELAGVGLTEDEAIAKGYSVRTGSFPLVANGKSLIENEATGLVKFVVDSTTDEILGMHMAGSRATEIIHEGVLAMRLECTIDEIITTIHGHPTVSESVQEAGLAVLGRPIHIPSR